MNLLSMQVKRNKKMLCALRIGDKYYRYPNRDKRNEYNHFHFEDNEICE